MRHDIKFIAPPAYSRANTHPAERGLLLRNLQTCEQANFAKTVLHESPMGLIRQSKYLFRLKEAADRVESERD
jgi:hypothetical protein